MGDGRWDFNGIQEHLLSHQTDCCQMKRDLGPIDFIVEGKEHTQLL